MSEKERIELIMKSYNLTPSQFADRCGIQRASVSHILSGRNKPSLEVMLKIFESFSGLDMTWLMTGKGDAPAFELQQQNITEEASRPQPSIPELFSQPSVGQQPIMVAEPEPQKPQKPQAVPRQTTVERQQRRASSRVAVQNDNPSPQRRVKEIRIFYTDGTYETMYPEK